MAKTPAAKKKDAPRRVPRAAKKLARPAQKRRVKHAETDFGWVRRQLENPDPYFSMEHALAFLHDLFDHLVKARLTTCEEVERFVEGAHGPVTLEQIFRHFKLK